MGGLGFSYGYIAKITGLRIGEVGYAITVAGSKPTLYRRGETKLAQVVRKQVGRPARALLEGEIDRLITRTLKL